MNLSLPLEIINAIVMACSINAGSAQSLDVQRHCQAVLTKCVETAKTSNPVQGLQTCLKDEKVK